MGPFTNALRGMGVGRAHNLATPGRSYGNDIFQMMQRPEWQEYMRRFRSGGDTSYMFPNRLTQQVGLPSWLGQNTLAGGGPGFGMRSRMQPQTIQPQQVQMARQQYLQRAAPNAGSATGGPYRPKF